MKKFTVSQNEDLKTFTDNVYPQGSFAYARLLRDRDIRVNGQRTGKNIPLRTGDEVVYYTTVREEGVPAFERVYEDENILVADKYSGVNSEALFFALSSEGELYFIHRLDRNTAGLIVFAKNRAAEQALLKAFRTRKVKKTYLAVCVGAFERSFGVMNAYLVKNARAAHVQIYSEPQKGAEKITTEYSVLENGGEYSLVQIVLHSGKTHQIRAHMAHIGHPVAGDEKYGCEAFNRRYGVRRQLLVAKYLAIEADGVLSCLRGKIFASRFSPDLPKKS